MWGVSSGSHSEFRLVMLAPSLILSFEPASQGFRVVLVVVRMASLALIVQACSVRRLVLRWPFADYVAGSRAFREFCFSLIR